MSRSHQALSAVSYRKCTSQAPDAAVMEAMGCLASRGFFVKSLAVRGPRFRAAPVLIYVLIPMCVLVTRVLEDIRVLRLHAHPVPSHTARHGGHGR